MKRKKEITCTFYVGDKQVEELTPEQLETMSQRLSETMSAYYTKHPEEYKVLLGGNHE